MKAPFQKSWYNHLLAIVIFFIISLFYCKPIFEGKNIAGGDMIQGEVMGHEAKEFSNGDARYIGWIGTMFSGMPTNYGVPKVERNLFSYVPYFFGNQFMNGHYSFDVFFWMMLGAYILFLSLKSNYWASIAIAVSYAFCSFTVISLEAGHVMKVMNMAFMAPMFAGVIWIAQNKYIKGGIVLMISAGITFAINHSQIVYYTMLVMAILGIVLLVYKLKNKETKNALIGAGLITLIISIGFMANYSMLNLLASSKETIRGESTLNSDDKKSGVSYNYAIAWSNGVGETMTFFAPDVYGGSIAENFVMDKNSKTYKYLVQMSDNQMANQLVPLATHYFGEQSTTGGIYAGIIILMLFVIGFVLMDTPTKIWVGLSTLIFLLLAFGGNFKAYYEFFYNYMPFFNKFRTPSMAFAVVQLMLAVGAVVGLSKLITKEATTAQLQKAFYIGAGLVGGILVILYIAPSVFLSFTSARSTGAPDAFLSALIADRKEIVSASVLRSLIFVALASATIFLYLKGKLKATPLLVIVGVLSLTDVWGNAKRFLNDDDFHLTKNTKNAFIMTAADQQIKTDNDPHYRVFNAATSTFNDAITSYHHKSIGGYHAFKLKRYQDIIERHLSGMPNFEVLNMLNAKYFIFSPSQDAAPMVQRNFDAAGNGWFVNDVKLMNTSDEEIEALKADSVHKFKATEVALVHKDFASQIKDFKAGTKAENDKVQLTSYDPMMITYDVQSQNGGLAVFSEIFYQLKDGDGWKAYIDGQEVPTIRANYVLRALMVPAGNHKVEFVYNADALLGRYRIAFIFSLIGIAGIAVGIYLSTKEKYKKYI